MARNGSGTYNLSDTLTASTTATAAEVNAILQDIATALTGSLAIDGQATMTGVLKAANGSAAAPSYTFGSDTNSGFYRISADTIGLALNGALVATFSTSGMALASGKTLGSTADIVVTDNITANAVTLAKLATQADQTILANISGGVAVPTAATLTAILDDIIGNTRGDILVRGASAWQVLALGASGEALVSDGTDIAWGAALPSQSGNSGKFLTTNGTAASWGSPIVAACNFTAGASPTVTNDTNISGVVQNGTGDYTITLSSGSATCHPQISCISTANRNVNFHSKTSTDFRIITSNMAGASADATSYEFIAFA